MGDLTWKATRVAPGLAACAAAAALGTPLVFAIVAVVAYALSIVLPRTPSTVALLVAPLVVAAGSPLHTLVSLAALAWIAIAVASAAPVFLTLGGGIPARGAVLAAATALGLSTLVAVLPSAWSATIAASDVAARYQVVLLLFATLLVFAVSAWTKRESRA